MLISIIIINYNTAQLLDRCLDSIEKFGGDADYEIIVVDNNSTEGSIQDVKSRHPNAHFVDSPINVGFGRACNLASRRAKGDKILLLNPDAEILEDTLSTLQALVGRHPDAGIWGGATIGEDGALDPTFCRRFPTIWGLITEISDLSQLFKTSPIFNRDTYVDWDATPERGVEVVTGCFLLIERKLWDALKGFDPDYFMYSEEIDLCFRAHTLGARPVASTRTSIIHLGGKSETVRSRTVVLILKGKITFFKKNWRPFCRKVGIFLTYMWPWSRCAAYAVLAKATRRPRHIERAETWKIVWQNRLEWKDGYPAVESPNNYAVQPVEE